MSEKGRQWSDLGPIKIYTNPKSFMTIFYSTWPSWTLAFSAASTSNPRSSQSVKYRGSPTSSEMIKYYQILSTKDQNMIKYDHNMVKIWPKYMITYKVPQLHLINPLYYLCEDDNKLGDMHLWTRWSLADWERAAKQRKLVDHLNWPSSHTSAI